MKGFAQFLVNERIREIELLVQKREKNVLRIIKEINVRRAEQNDLNSRWSKLMGEVEFTQDEVDVINEGFASHIILTKEELAFNVQLIVAKRLICSDGSKEKIKAIQQIYSAVKSILFS